MMQALIAGGMTAAYSDERDQMAVYHADEHYQPNPGNKLLEIPLREYGDVNFPLKYQDGLIKVMLWGLDHLAVNPDGYRAIIMRRDPEEIRQSYEAFFGQTLRHPGWKEYDARIDRAVEMLANRDDVKSARVCHYSDVIANPLGELLKIREQSYWPINAAKAAATINPDLYRFRRERLTVGI